MRSLVGWTLDTGTAYEYIILDTQQAISAWTFDKTEGGGGAKKSQKSPTLAELSSPGTKPTDGVGATRNELKSAGCPLPLASCLIRCSVVVLIVVVLSIV